MGAHFGKNARVSQVEIDYDAKPLAVEATVFTPSYRDECGAGARASGWRLVLGQPVEVKIEQFTVGSEQGEAEATQIAAARGAASEATRARLAERLALVAGVPRRQGADRPRAQPGRGDGGSAARGGSEQLSLAGGSGRGSRAALDDYPDPSRRSSPGDRLWGG